MSKFVELHNHGYHSIMDGFNSPTEIVEVAKSLGHGAAALTDHGTLAGHRELQRATAEAGIKPILGVEAYISPTDRFDRRSVKKRDDNTQVYHHLILHAKSQQGLRNLQAMSQRAWDEGFYHKPRIDKELLDEYGDGLIVLSGCLNGLVSKALHRIVLGLESVSDDFDMEELTDEQAQEYLEQLKLATGEHWDAANEWTQWFKQRFADDFYMEIQPHNPKWLNEGLLDLATLHGVRPVVTNDCHFALEQDRDAEEIMLTLSTNPKPVKDRWYSDVDGDVFEMLEKLYVDRPISFAHLDLFLKSEERVVQELVDAGIEPQLAQSLVEATHEVADKVEAYEYQSGLDLLPKFQTERPDAEQLRLDVRAGLRARGVLDDSVYTKQAEHELEVIEQLKFSRYFLIVADAIGWARDQGILVGPGRGSAAGSLVCYALGITDVDPIEHGLLFFRFLDPERASLVYDYSPVLDSFVEEF